MITKRCFVCKGVGKYGRLYSGKSDPQVCKVCHGYGKLFYPTVQTMIKCEDMFKCRGYPLKCKYCKKNEARLDFKPRQVI